MSKNPQLSPLNSNRLISKLRTNKIPINVKKPSESEAASLGHPGMVARELGHGHTGRVRVRVFASRLSLHKCISMKVTTPRVRIRRCARKRGPFWEMQKRNANADAISVWPRLYHGRCGKQGTPNTPAHNPSSTIMSSLDTDKRPCFFLFCFNIWHPDKTWWILAFSESVFPFLVIFI